MKYANHSFAFEAPNDILKGGTGVDTYYASQGDTIKDTDGLGSVLLQGRLLTGGHNRTGTSYFLSADGQVKFYLSGRSLVAVGYNDVVQIQDWTSAKNLGAFKRLNGSAGVVLQAASDVAYQPCASVKSIPCGLSANDTNWRIAA